MCAFVSTNSCYCWHSCCSDKKKNKKQTQCTFSQSTFTVLAETAHPALRVHKAQVGSLKWYITRLHIALYIPNMNSLLSEYTFQVTKRNKRREREKKRMYCVARVSIKFKAIFRAHRSLLIVIDHHRWTLTEEVITHWWTWGLGGDFWWEEWLHRDMEEEGKFSFHNEFNTKKQKNPQFFILIHNLSLSLFGREGKKKVTCVAFSQIVLVGLFFCV